MFKMSISYKFEAICRPICVGNCENIAERRKHFNWKVMPECRQPDLTNLKPLDLKSALYLLEQKKYFPGATG
jgi:hypothetical protein